MKSVLKHIIRRILISLKFDLTQNLKYDRLSEQIVKQEFLGHHINALDIGAHDGDFLDLYLKHAPNGIHIGFEPLPHKFEKLQKKYAKSCIVYPYALSNYVGESTFNYVKNAEAYSGLRPRKYDTKTPLIEKIDVQVKTLDSLTIKHPIHFIKIDVEGGEFDALKGGVELLKRDMPMLLFEFGTGASDFYKTSAEAMYSFLCEEIGYCINTLEGYLSHKNQPLNFTDFNIYYTEGTEYYFTAYKLD